MNLQVLPEYLTWLTCFVPWIALTPVVFRVERQFAFTHSTWPRHAAVLFLISLPVTAFAGGAGVLLAAGIQTVFDQSVEAARGSATIPLGGFLMEQFFFWSTLGAGRMLRALGEARENERRAARLLLEKSQLEASLRQAELDALRNRLDPHFLFNSLQNISILIQHDPGIASRMLTRLGDLLRASLRRDGRAETTLREEIELTRSYLAIEQMRFGDRLSSAIEIAEGTASALVPALLLQPLVENAIRHGLSRVRHRGVITIRSTTSEQSLDLTVADNGAGIPNDPFVEGRVGIGLGATCERLERMYPGRYSFTMRALAEGGTEVHITLPLKFGPAKEDPRDAGVATAHR